MKDKNRLYVGTDIVEIRRLTTLVQNERFLEKVFTAPERDYIDKTLRREERMAGLYAAKEAVSKLFGMGIGRLSFLDMEIVHTPEGKPILALSAQGRAIAAEKGISDVDLSISHDGGLAIAVAVGYMSARVPKQYPEDLPMLKERERNSHKGTYGKVAIIGGSAGMTGSVLLASRAALRCGSGLVYTLVPRSLAGVVEARSTENIVVPIDDGGSGHFTMESLPNILEFLAGCDAACFGPGVGRFLEIQSLLKGLLEKCPIPMVLDADGLYALAQDPQILSCGSGQLVLTPHPMEMARLIGESVAQVQGNRELVAKSFSTLYNVTVVLKGSGTIVSHQQRQYINPNGNTGMATAGSGDVLTGMITSLLGQQIHPYEAAVLGVFLHGSAGDLAADDLGEDGMIAGDIIEAIPHAIKEKREHDRGYLDTAHMG
ncbi:MAG: NAD(P)H-hydrate dehydratase [Tissierellia bacterium]|nr:NAD(P)H-hydrate dehydratase [Tissierellia bacterium]